MRRSCWGRQRVKELDAPSGKGNRGFEDRILTYRKGTCSVSKLRGMRLFAIGREFGFHGYLVTPRLRRCAT